MNKCKKIDFLIVTPSANWEEDERILLAMRLDDKSTNQNTPLYSVTAVITPAIEAGYSVEQIDMRADRVSIKGLIDIIIRTGAKLVGFTAFTRQINDVGKMAMLIKDSRSDVVICCGGPHVSALPVETLEEFPAIDFVVRGEADEVILKVLDMECDINKISKIEGVITRGKKDISWVFVEDINKLPYPAWYKYDLSKYGGIHRHGTELELPLITGRGCPYKCTFCCRANGDIPRRKEVSVVIGEIEHYIEKYGCKTLAILDENFVLKNSWLKEFFEKMIKRGLNKKVKWSCSMRVNLVTEELMERMKDAGCYYIFFGFESANDKTLKAIKKGITTSKMLDAVNLTKKVGIIPTGAFMIGLPGDTESEVYQAIELGKKLDLFSITFPIAVPYPGTELREEALRNKYGMRILTNDWSKYGKKDPDGYEGFKILESDDFSAERRIEMQKIAYAQHPKKNIDEYLGILK